MWISKSRLTEIESRLSELEKENHALKEKNSSLDRDVQGLKHDILFKICSNSMIKEEYNFRLLLHLFDKLGIEPPDLENKFTM